jgi:hypothetical protein
MKMGALNDLDALQERGRLRRIEHREAKLTIKKCGVAISSSAPIPA